MLQTITKKQAVSFNKVTLVSKHQGKTTAYKPFTKTLPKNLLAKTYGFTGF